MTTTSARAIVLTNTGQHAHITPSKALHAILAEVTPGQTPYSSASYMPDHLVKAARTALDGNSLEASQHAHNALSTAAWHVRAESLQRRWHGFAGRRTISRPAWKERQHEQQTAENGNDR